MNHKVLIAGQSDLESLFDDAWRVAWPEAVERSTPGKNGQTFDSLFRNIFVIPFLSIGWFFKLAYRKFYLQLKTVVCLDRQAKLVLTPGARLLKLKTVWIEEPDAVYRQTGRYSRWLARRVETVTLTRRSADNFLAAYGREPQVFRPSLKYCPRARQATIYETLAATNRHLSGRKFFTLGAVAWPGAKGRLELLFKAARAAMESVPEIQLMLLGGADDKKAILWLAKKIGVDTIVWAVGRGEERNAPSRWFPSLDALACPLPEPSAADLRTALAALDHGLPIVAASGGGWNDFIIDNQNGLLALPDDAEDWNRALIDLGRHSWRRRELGQAENAAIRTRDFLALTDSFKKLTS